MKAKAKSQRHKLRDGAVAGELKEGALRVFTDSMHSISIDPGYL